MTPAIARARVLVPTFTRAAERLWAFLRELPEPRPQRWSFAAALGLGSLVCFWGALFAFTWGRWGNLTVDCGREIYVPWQLMQGRVLYRDLWYPYTPLAPYLNSLLFEAFGPRVEVLYWAGSLSALATAVLLFLVGMRLSSWIAGATAGAVLLLEAFTPSLFSFPLSYSFGAVYGLPASCACLWCCVRAAGSGGRRWVLGAACAAAVAFLMKSELGVGCYAGLAVLLAARALVTRSPREVGLDLAVTLPGIVACAATVAWMVSLGGVEFLTQENIISWPSSWFMQRYGKRWLARQGLHASAPQAVLAILVVAPCYVFRKAFRRFGLGAKVLGVGSAALLALGLGGEWLFPGVASEYARLLIYPPSLVFLAMLASGIALGLWWWRGRGGGFLACALLLLLSSTVGIRCLFGAAPTGYSIFYTGPAVLSFLLLLRWAVVPGSAMEPARASPALLLPYLAVLGVVSLSLSEPYAKGRRLVALPTERGTVYAPPEKVAPYRAAIAFMQEKGRAGEATLTIPEDVILYFLSGTRCPIRLYTFTPGVVAPGPMTERLLIELEEKSVPYLIWSNRQFPEYGVPQFGVDFDQPLGDYLRSRYRPDNPLPAPERAEWQATVWKRL